MKQTFKGYEFKPTDVLLGWIHGVAWTKNLYQWFKDGIAIGPPYVYDEDKDRYFPWYG